MNEKRITPWQRTRDVAVSQRRLRRAATSLEALPGAASKHEAARLRGLERALSRLARFAQRAGERLTDAVHRREERRRAAVAVSQLAWQVVDVATAAVPERERRVLPRRHAPRVRELLMLERRTKGAFARAERSLALAVEEELVARRAFLSVLFEARAAIAQAQAMLARQGVKVTSRGWLAEPVSPQPT